MLIFSKKCQKSCIKSLNKYELNLSKNLIKCSSPKNCKIYLFWNLFCSLTIVAKMVKRYRAEMQTAANWIQKWLLIAQRIVLLLRKDFYSFSSKIYALAGKQGCSVRLNPCPLSRTPSIFIYSDLLKFDFRQVWSLDYII